MNSPVHWATCTLEKRTLWTINGANSVPFYGSVRLLTLLPLKPFIQNLWLGRLPRKSQ